MTEMVTVEGLKIACEILKIKFEEKMVGRMPLLLLENPDYITGDEETDRKVAIIIYDR